MRVNDRADSIDSFVMSTVCILADKHNIKPEIDLETRQINLTGGTDHDQHQLAQDLEEMLGNHTI